MTFGGISLLVAGSLFAANPSSTSYTLKSYDFGSGGGTGSSTSYNLNGISGTQNSATNSSTSFNINGGLSPTIDSNVPPAPSFTNPSSYYNRLQLIISTGNNASDTKFAIAISSDGFVTTRYVKADQSIGNTLTSGDYRTYAAWGGASGFLVLGLESNTTYQVKVKAMQGGFTETGYGPTASAATVFPTLSFGLITSLSGTPPFGVDFSSLPAGSVVTGSATANLSFSTNALSGGAVYVRGTSGGLSSVGSAYTLTSASADLASASLGYGARVASVGQVSGGPVVSLSPYNGSGDIVGILDASLRELASTAGPVTSGAATVQFKAKTDSSVPAATDYTDVLTFIAAMAY